MRLQWSPTTFTADSGGQTCLKVSVAAALRLPITRLGRVTPTHYSEVQKGPGAAAATQEKTIPTQKTRAVPQPRLGLRLGRRTERLNGSHSGSSYANYVRRSQTYAQPHNCCTTRSAFVRRECSLKASLQSCPVRYRRVTDSSGSEETPIDRLRT